MSLPPRRKLSQSEVAALVDGLKELESDGTDAEYKLYRFGQDNQSILGDFHGLRMINERFCRIARSVFLPFLRIHPRISGFPPEVKPFSRYCDEQDNFTSLTFSRIDELRGTQLIVLNPSFISLMTDAYFGGDIRNPVSRRNEFTATEARVIELLTESLNEALSQAWKDLTPLTFRVQTREENLQFATFVEAKETVVVCSFLVQLPGTEPASIDIIYPLQTLKPIASQLRSRMQSDRVAEDIGWRAKLERAMLQVPLNVSARLAEPDVPLALLERAEEGDTLPVRIEPDLQLLVEDMPLFAAELGDVAGRSALSLTRTVTPS